MLVLFRKVGESVVIGNDIRVTVLSVGQYGDVRLGIAAPRDIAVDRKEVYERKLNETARFTEELQ